jgi:transposase, IS5 family
VSDTRMTVPALRWFKEKYGKFPWELLADRGMWKRAAAKWLRLAGIGCGIQVKGKEVPETSVTRRQIRQRLPIEARISLIKRCFGGARCRARNDDHEESWIRLGMAAMNAHLAYGRSP